MKIVYISSSIIPSRAANSIQVMRMCEGFANLGHDLTLLAPHRPGKYEDGVDDIWEFYGVEQNFKLKKLRFPQFKGGSQVYGFLCGKETAKMNPDLVYGRHIPGLWWAKKFGNDMALELHSPVKPVGSLGSRISYWMYSRLIASDLCQGFVVISDALKKWSKTN